MKKIIFLFFILITISKAFASEITLEITEFFPDPEGKDNSDFSNREFIELYNYGNEEINLSEVLIKNLKNNTLLLKEFISINKDKYLVVYPSKDLSLKNSGEEKLVILYNNSIVDEARYSHSEEGFSWSKINNEWLLTNPTPGNENKIQSKELIEIKKITPSKIIFGSTVKINVEIETSGHKESKNFIYIENLTEKIEINLKDKFRKYNMNIPLSIPQSCNSNYSEGKYILKIKGKTSIRKNITINKEKCPKEVSIKEDKSIKTQNIKPVLENAENKAIYESIDLKQRKLALYAFSATLIIAIICLIVEDGGWKRDKSKGNNRSSWNP